MSRARLFGLLLAAGAPPAAAQERPAAIVASFDALNLRRLLETVPASATPAFRAYLAAAACTDGARPMTPSVTAAGHAALWTGAWGDVNGITANETPRLPLAGHTILETASGYDAPQLRAEPLWITAARQGRRVVGHHVTQAPGIPGRPEPAGQPDSARRARDATALGGRGVLVLNGYNRRVAPARVLTPDSLVPDDPARWRGLRRRGAVPPRAWAFAIARDSFFVLATVERRGPTLRIARLRHAGAGVTLVAAPAERAPVRGRPLARHFAVPLRIAADSLEAWVHFRLFALAPDLGTFRLFHAEVRAVEANDGAGRRAYDRAVLGFVGNSGWGPYDDGALGPTADRGGDGEAEARLLETYELAARQFIRGSEAAWRLGRPDLHLDYLPLLDDVDHQFLGLVSPEAPGYDARVAAIAQEVRARVYALADLRLEALQALARRRGALLVVTGDHGMRPYWRTLRLNVLLREAGLLVTDSAGRIDLTRTRAASPNGQFIAINRIARRQGIVPPDAEAAVRDSVLAVLRAARDEQGAPLVTATYVAGTPAGDSLGIGAPNGGEIHVSLAPGTYFVRGHEGEALRGGPARGAHGFPSVEPDMHTAFCAAGPGLTARTLPTGRLIDVAPTVAEWLGIAPPEDARGRSLLGAFRGTP